MSNFYGATSLIGGGSGALDAIDGAALADLDGAFVLTTTKFYPYILDVDNAGGESSPGIIAPDDNSGDKRWILNGLVCADIVLSDGGTIGQAAGPLLTFDDTLDLLKVTGCKVFVRGDGNPGVYDTHALFNLTGAADPKKRLQFGFDTTDDYGWIRAVHVDTGLKDLVLQPDGGKVGINDAAPAEMLDVNGNINATGVVKVDDVQVIQARIVDARCDDAINSGDATTDGVIDALRDAMITHGLVAAA